MLGVMNDCKLKKKSLHEISVPLFSLKSVTLTFHRQNDKDISGHVWVEVAIA